MSIFSIWLSTYYIFPLVNFFQPTAMNGLIHGCPLRNLPFSICFISNSTFWYPYVLQTTLHLGKAKPTQRRLLKTFVDILDVKTQTLLFCRLSIQLPSPIIPAVFFPGYSNWSSSILLYGVVGCRKEHRVIIHMQKDPYICKHKNCLHYCVSLILSCNWVFQWSWHTWVQFNTDLLFQRAK